MVAGDPAEKVKVIFLCVCVCVSEECHGWQGVLALTPTSAVSSKY